MAPPLQEGNAWEVLLARADSGDGLDRLDFEAVHGGIQNRVLSALYPDVSIRRMLVVELVAAAEGACVVDVYYALIHALLKLLGELAVLLEHGLH